MHNKIVRGIITPSLHDQELIALTQQRDTVVIHTDITTRSCTLFMEQKQVVKLLPHNLNIISIQTGGIIQNR